MILHQEKHLLFQGAHLGVVAMGLNPVEGDPCQVVLMVSFILKLLTNLGKKNVLMLGIESMNMWDYKDHELTLVIWCSLRNVFSSSQSK